MCSKIRAIFDKFRAVSVTIRSHFGNELLTAESEGQWFRRGKQTYRHQRAQLI